MRTRDKYLLTAALVEAPLLIALVQTKFIWVPLVWYHFGSLAAVTALWLLLFGHGSPSFGPQWFWNCIQLGFIYLLQVPIAALLIFLLMFLFRRLVGRPSNQRLERP